MKHKIGDLIISYFFILIKYNMKIIKKNEYHNDGVFINLDTTFVPYDNLLNNHYKYLSKDKKYYFYCHSGKKAKRVALILEAYGYDTTLVLN